MEEVPDQPNIVQKKEIEFASEEEEEDDAPVPVDSVEMESPKAGLGLDQNEGKQN